MITANCPEALKELATRPALEIPGAMSSVESAEMGVNQVMLMERGLPIAIDSNGIKPGDSVLVYLDTRLVLVLPVKKDHAGQPITPYIPATLIPEGVFTLKYRVNLERSAPLKVRVKTRLPGGIDKPLAAPYISSTTLNAQQDETVIVPAYEGMCPNDKVTLMFGNWALLHTVKADEVGQPLTFTLSRDKIAGNGDGAVVLYYTVCDELRNCARDHSPGCVLMIQRGTNEPVLPTVECTDQQHTLYLSRLGSRSAKVSLDTQDFAPGDTLKLVWRGLDRTGKSKMLTLEQTLEISSRLDFKIPNAVLQELAGGSARLFFTRTDVHGATQTLPATDILIVGHTRGISEAPHQPTAAPEDGVLQIAQPTILGATEAVEGADCGVSLRIYDNSDLNGARVLINPVTGAVALDVVDLLLNGRIVDTLIIQSGTVNCRHEMKLPKLELMPDRINLLQATISRVSHDTETSSSPLRVLYNAIRPGNKDLDCNPGHSELQLKLPQDVIDNGLDAERVALGVEVSFCYPYCRPHDVIELTMGNLTVRFTVSPDELPRCVANEPQCIVRTLTAQQFRQAANGPRLTLFYTVQDQIKNGPDPMAPYSAHVVFEADHAGVHRHVPASRAAIGQATHMLLAPGAVLDPQDPPSQIPIISAVTARDQVIPHTGVTYYRNSLVIRGRATAGRPVVVYEGVRNLGRFAVDANGEWVVPARAFAVARHVITVRSIDSTQHSPPYVFTVQPGLSGDRVVFDYPDYQGWVPHDPDFKNVFSFFQAPGGRYCVLKTETVSGAAPADILSRSFNNLQPGASYRLQVAVVQSATGNLQPSLRLRSSTGAASDFVRLNNQVLEVLSLHFVPPTPEGTLYLESGMEGGRGNVFDMAWVTLDRAPLAPMSSASNMAQIWG
ncbi:hypothetical protein [Pseudomonas nunensis]|uniref:Uncharacterized protein n=1 Tax=Pseudomonas nunensis TaxID=2961896 RepID=A0ABY5ELB2_9PSED|nr:hypothetical protein [Pseudomonas nunensis]KPN93547.1 hypothetical protein AL066_01430 [Pseudomonas nunensis]MCL5228048.1 hypothetical protein [Pseudomonas nunensis]UTO15067.1 hypothetical protein NK667_01485 [Pseudomonas nunensis]